jgi:hypothetical protein
MEKRAGRRYQRLLDKHREIQRGGLSITAYVVKAYAGKTMDSNTRLIHLKLRINILDGNHVLLISKCLFPANQVAPERRSLSIKFLPADLSQVVILS